MSLLTSGAVIAAGEGSRLKSLGVPKPLVEVDGVPLIDHVLGNFEAAGIASVAVIFNEAEEDVATLVRARYGRLVSRIVVKSTRSSLESFREMLAEAASGRLLVSTVDAYCPREEFVRFVERARKLPAASTVLGVTRFVDDEKPLWVKLAAGERRAGGAGGRSPAEPPEEFAAGAGRVTAVGGSSGDAVTAGIYVLPERVRKMSIPGELGRLRDFLAWLAQSGEEIHAIEIPKVVDVDRVEDLAEAQALAALGVRGRV